ncbi:predicted protein [Chaetomium globosum CBS 148.51]|uniref:Uncharacterized protein n=1 Tax=Chaetomium globosum (strain ATCC 6205 / CBS 148.51 / DSM 1962 / NBRC 6347 / NRRL 1970) TaxID=306901 RepID=Q2GV48_CHAGB|nr:uncharacterized protein CHGG_08156 [Chaetomium globosum CBS 148.51]EAQ86903.1 predicted protein [Chaetomium globosum CBS 148.51]
MSRNQPPDKTIGDGNIEAIHPIPNSSAGSAPSVKCNRTCCRISGENWFRYHHRLTNYPNGPALDTLFFRGNGAWAELVARIQATAEMLEHYDGLACWHDLSLGVREKLESWSPMAKELWKSDFSRHQEALVKVWIWRYVERALFFFSSNTASPDGDVACCSPVWERVRTHARDLQPVRTITDDALRKHICRVQFNEWRRITDHLVRMGLGQKEFATAAVLMAHCKTSIRQLLVDGETRLPNLVHDADWKAKGDEHDEADVISHHLKMVLHYALRVQHCFHSLEMTCSLRLTPIDSDKLWGFPFDEGQMKLFNPPELRRPRDDKELPSVQLVCDPMLVDIGLHDKGNGKVLTQHAPMSVVTPWVYAGNEAEKYTRDHFKEDVERRRAKRYQREVRREAGLPAEEEIKGGRRRGKTARVRKLEKQKVEALRKMANDLLAEQEKKAKELRDEQKKEAEALRAKQQRKAKELWAKQQAEMNKATSLWLD